MLKADAQDPRAWWIGLTFALVVFAGLTAVGLWIQGFGWSFVVGAPLVTGYVIGRFIRTAFVIKVVCGLLAVAAVILGAVTTSLAGAICGFVFGMIAAIPLFVGVVLGSALSGKHWTPQPLACVAFVAVLIPLEHGVDPIGPIEQVVTTETLSVAAATLFDRITFYEDTTEEPPRLLRIALPRPVRTLGDASHVGDRPRCIYDKGYIIKEITRIDRNRYYAFKVIEQVGVESHAVRLVGGSFRFVPLGPRFTRVVLTTRYRSKLTARSAWRPLERSVIRKLHHHVLASMAEAR